MQSDAKIVLIRHGQPEFNTRKWIGIHGARNSLEEYKHSRVTAGPVGNHVFYDDVVQPHFMCSGLARARDSSLLCHSVQPEVSDLFNESELPCPDRLLFPLPWSVLLVVCRLGWLFGYDANASGINHDIARAKNAAALLAVRASQHAVVYVFGHGVMNRLITRELKRSGWKSQSRVGSGYWGQVVMSLRAE